MVRAVEALHLVVVAVVVVVAVAEVVAQEVEVAVEGAEVVSKNYLKKNHR